MSVDSRYSAHVFVRGSAPSAQLGWRVFALDPSSYAKTAEVSISFSLYGSDSPDTQRDLRNGLKASLQRAPQRWLSLDGQRWRIDCGNMRESFIELKNNPNFDWLRGVAVFEPEYINEDSVEEGEMVYNRSLAVEISPETMGNIMSATSYPIEISDSLARFRNDHPDPSKVAFIMMRFGTTKAHNQIVKAVREALQGVGLVGLRADDKEYHGQLINNIQTYMHGAGVGIAIFERLENDDFNPNVSLELGYMMALGKPVCLLKDRTQRGLPTDIVGRLYRAFDPQSPDKDIRRELVQWLKDNSIV